jgi:hypothetical protein
MFLIPVASARLFGQRKPGPSLHSGIFDGPGQVSMALPVDMSSGFGVLGHWSIRNSKSQITNIKQITMTKIRNSKPLFCFGH